MFIELFNILFEKISNKTLTIQKKIIREWRGSEPYGFIRLDGSVVTIPSDLGLVHEEFVARYAYEYELPPITDKDKTLGDYLKKTGIIRFSGLDFEIHGGVSIQQLNRIKSMSKHNKNKLSYDVYDFNGKPHVGYGFDNLVNDLVNFNMIRNI